MKRNTITANAGTTLFVYSKAGFNYERLLRYSEDRFISHYYLNMGIARFVQANGFAPAPIPYGIDTSLRLVLLTGKNENHLETGAGFSVGFVRFYRFPDPNQNEEDTITWPNFLLGYRYQTDDLFIFRVGAAFPEGVYISIGLAF